MQDQLDALDSIVAKLVQRAESDRDQNAKLRQELASTKSELAETKDQLAQARQKLEDTGIRIGLLIEQLTKDTSLEPDLPEEAPAEEDAAPGYQSFG